MIISNIQASFDKNNEIDKIKMSCYVSIAQWMLKVEFMIIQVVSKNCP